MSNNFANVQWKDTTTLWVRHFCETSLLKYMADIKLKTTKFVTCILLKTHEHFSDGALDFERTKKSAIIKFLWTGKTQNLCHWRVQIILLVILCSRCWKHFKYMHDLHDYSPVIASTHHITSQNLTQ